MISVKFQGGRDLVKRLEALPSAVSRKVQITALTEGAKPIQARASALAPRDEKASPPHLADNIVIGAVSEAQIIKRGREGETVVEVGPSLKPSDHFYGFFQEFGVAHHPAQPFMRPAFDENAPRSLNIILSAFWTAIRKVLPDSFGGRSSTSRAA